MRSERRLRPPAGRILAGNLVGAMITAFYVNRIDPQAAMLGSPPTARPLPFFVVGFARDAALSSAPTRPRA